MKPLFSFLYVNLLKPILFLFDAEFCHNLFTDVGEFLGKFSFTKSLTRLIYGYKGKDISKTVDGITYTTPILLSAGFDYNARLINILKDVGFGGEELGSVTFRPCEGNEKPRLSRAIKSKSMIVWKGLRNDGAEVISERIAQNRKEPQLCSWC